MTEVYQKRDGSWVKVANDSEFKFGVGYVYETISAVETATALSLRYGGTWEELPERKEWDDVNETTLANPAGLTGVVSYSVHNNVVTVKFDSIITSEPVYNYFLSIPAKYNPNANQICSALVAWGDTTTRNFVCVNTSLTEGNVYVRRTSNTNNTTYGHITYACGGGTPDRVYKRFRKVS